MEEEVRGRERCIIATDNRKYVATALAHFKSVPRNEILRHPSLPYSEATGFPQHIM
jgi:hypothetical protein